LGFLLKWGDKQAAKAQKTAHRNGFVSDVYGKARNVAGRFGRQAPVKRCLAR